MMRSNTGRDTGKSTPRPREGAEATAGRTGLAGAADSPLARVRKEIANLRQALLEPGTAALDPLIPKLEGASRDLIMLADGLADGLAGGLGDGLAAAGKPPRNERAALTAEAMALKAELEHVAHLTSQGAEFWRGWARLLGFETAPELNYTAAGVESQATPAISRPRISVEG